MSATILKPDEYYITQQPYYEPIANEITIFEAAYRNKLALSLKGPTGCGKTRFMEYMAWRLKLPLITVSCHDDLTASDLIGRYLITENQTVWIDGPLTAAVRAGAICYLDEIVEARADTTVVIHPLADDRRVLPIEKLGELLLAPDSFCMTISYNPGYQSVLKDIKQSTRQRFVSLEFDYPAPELEEKIVQTESGLDAGQSRQLIRFAQLTRNLKGAGLDEGASTRLLVHAGKLIVSGVDPVDACASAIAQTLSDDGEMIAAMKELSASVF